MNTENVQPHRIIDWMPLIEGKLRLNNDPEFMLKQKQSGSRFYKVPTQPLINIQRRKARSRRISKCTNIDPFLIHFCFRISAHTVK